MSTTMKRPKTKTKTAPQRTVYPWAEWSKDNQNRTYTKGEHFFVSVNSFATAAYSFAQRNKIPLRISRTKDSNSINLQFHYSAKAPKKAAPVVKATKK